VRLRVRFDRTLARITWIGHSTVLIELDGVRLLTDPVFRPRVLHLRRVGASPPAVDRVDAVLISHGHYDHLDAKSLARLDRETRVIVPVRAAARLRDFEDVVEVAVGDEVSVGSVTVTATPAEHSRGTVGYLVAGSARIYFAGDTDLFDGMRELGRIDVALLPVAGWGPRLPPGHLNPWRAAEALELIQPHTAIPIHWGTYAPWKPSSGNDAPAKELADIAATVAPAVDVRVLRPGQSYEMD